MKKLAQVKVVSEKLSSVVFDILEGMSEQDGEVYVAALFHEATIDPEDGCLVLSLEVITEDELIPLPSEEEVVEND